MIKTPVWLLCLFLISTDFQAQDIKQHNHNLSINYLQIKEEMNHGLVFRGPGINYSFSLFKKNSQGEIHYDVLFGLTYLQTRDIAAGNINFIPLKLDYLFSCNGGNLKLGPSLIADYNYELYPDLQSGYSYWFTNFCVGGILTYKFSIAAHKLALSLNTSIMGFTSRQPAYYDPYFFDLSLGDIMQFVHQDLTFGSWNRFNRTEFEIIWHPRTESRLAFAYVFNYHGYYVEPELSMVNQSVKLIIGPKSK